MKFCMMSYTMGQQKRYSVKDIVNTAVRLGMPGIDWVGTHGEKAETLKTLSEDAGLTVAAHTFSPGIINDGTEKYLDNAKRSIADAVTLGAPLVMIPTPQLPGVESRRRNRDLWCGALEKIAPLVRDANLILTVENFQGAYSPFLTAADFYEAKARIPDLKLTFDNGNCWIAEDPVESLKICFADVEHVHLKDWEEFPTGGLIGRDGKHYRASLIGEGSVDSLATMRELKRQGYAGYLNIEYVTNRYPADEAIATALKRLRGGLA